MKLAEALMLRADHQKKIAQLKERLLNNALVQDGEKPSENPTDLMNEFENTATELEDLIIRINRTNSTVKITTNQTFADMLAKRDVLKIKHQTFSSLAASAAEMRDRYSPSEIKYVSTINVADTRKKVDGLAMNFRKIDTVIQEFNWKTDLVE